MDLRRACATGAEPGPGRPRFRSKPEPLAGRASRARPPSRRAREIPEQDRGGEADAEETTEAADPSAEVRGGRLLEYSVARRAVCCGAGSRGRPLQPGIRQEPHRRVELPLGRET